MPNFLLQKILLNGCEMDFQKNLTCIIVANLLEKKIKEITGSVTFFVLKEFQGSDKNKIYNPLCKEMPIDEVNMN